MTNDIALVFSDFIAARAIIFVDMWYDVCRDWRGSVGSFTEKVR